MASRMRRTRFAASLPLASFDNFRSLRRRPLQSISLMAYLKEKKVTQPHLVLVPKSVLGNWGRELAKFCPSLKVLKLQAADKEERTRMVSGFGQRRHSKGMLCALGGRRLFTATVVAMLILYPAAHRSRRIC